MANIFTKNWISDYILHDKIDHRPDHTRNSNLSKLQVIDKYDEGVITMSDLYIVYAIHMMTFANMYQIMEYCKWWGTYNKDIPLFSGTDKEAFGNRLEALTKNSFIRRYKFNNLEDKARDYFYVTPNGYNFLRRKLYYNGAYDEFLGAAPLQEVLKYLANNEIMIQILKKSSVEQGYHIESKPIFVSHMQFFDKATRSNITTYGFFNIRKTDEKLKILLEPFRPTFDTGHYSKGHMDALQEGRFEFIRRYIDEYIKKNNGPFGLKVIFVAESMDAAKKLAPLIASSDSYLHSMMYITVDKIVEMHGLESTFLQLKTTDAKVGLIPVSLDL